MEARRINQKPRPVAAAGIAVSIKMNTQKKIDPQAVYKITPIISSLVFLLLL